MVNPNKKLKRPNNEGHKGKLPDGEIDVLEILQQHFAYIYRALKNEHPNINLTGEYELLKEIVIEKEVVGFSLYTFEFKYDYMYLEYLYVLPEYRDRFSLVDEFVDAEDGHMIAFIHNPTRDIVDKLIQDKVAYKLNNRFIVSNYGFVCDFISNDFALTETIENTNELKNYDGVNLYDYECSIYDLELCSAIPDIYSETGDKESKFKLSVAYKKDDEQYDCIKKRQEDVFIKEKRYMQESLEVFNEYMKINGEKLGFDLR